MRIQHECDNIEAARLDAFHIAHRLSCKIGGMIDGLFSYEITPTTIGTFVIVRCTKCKAEENITNVDVM